ncbi:hypothetical protein HYH03_004788 [Edaphochlamys debaryana]|uniref:Uncharacterized protein n=1 Tax=Edaphochlamys debaryana TaxID=47281 RepID=A0A836C320_9CHLO|nr:hypothetical protein HYH03_004788 [Edaphochlamys debaryana]|eukprot:KAG2497199.1 hypothetical protein HYH03_004788 [Edaphochlamys debaryana]
MRYGSKLAMRDPERFRRMQAILGYPDEASAPRVDRVTINLLQTFKYCSPDSDLLEDIAAYKVTSLNRELVPELDSVERLLKGLRAGGAGSGEGSGAAAGGGEAAKAKGAR